MTLPFDTAPAPSSPYGGLWYLSRLGDDLVNCAFFERGDPFPITHLERTDIESDDADYLRACRLLGLRPE